MKRVPADSAKKVPFVSGRFFVALLGLGMSTFLTGCHQDMWNQPRFAALQKSDFFPDKSAARLPVEGTVPYDGIRRKWSSPVFAAATGAEVVPSRLDDLFYTAREAQGFAPNNYFPVSQALLERGQQRFNVTCTPCHGMIGDGAGVVTQRGFPNPPSFHIDRLREVEDGYFFDVMTNGFGRMYSYAARVTPEDRWAIASYIRALQASQNVDLGGALAQEVQQGIAHQHEAEAAKKETAGQHAH